MNFNNVANTWDTERRIKRAKIISDFISERAKLHSDMSVFEFGCGTGLISYNLYPLVKSIIGYDNSEKMLDVFNQKIKDLNLNTIKSTNNLMTYANQIDCVISSMVFHHILDIKTQLIELSKIIKKDGQLFIVDLDQEDGSFHKDEIDFIGHNGFDRDEFSYVLKSINFEIIEVGTVLSDVKRINDRDVPYSLFYIKARKKYD